MSVDIKAIRWLLDNATAYAISKKLWRIYSGRR